MIVIKENHTVYRGENEKWYMTKYNAYYASAKKRFFEKRPCNDGCTAQRPDDACETCLKYFHSSPRRGLYSTMYEATVRRYTRFLMRMDVDKRRIGHQWLPNKKTCEDCLHYYKYCFGHFDSYRRRKKKRTCVFIPSRFELAEEETIKPKEKNNESRRSKGLVKRKSL